tara:strand:+ start:347 stop:532 length:186 start_codon:yes stop_codon:yes gene_type:complete
MDEHKVDQVLIDKIRQKLIDQNQSEELITQVINLLLKRDSEKIGLEKKNEAIDKIVKMIKL